MRKHKNLADRHRLSITQPADDGAGETLKAHAQTEDVVKAAALSSKRSEATNESGSAKLGDRLRAIRGGHGLTLAEAAQMTGVGISTLSKIENDQVSPTYDVLQKIVRGLQIDMVELFDTRQHELPSGRRDVTRAGKGSMHVTPKYAYELLATELSKKKFFPLRATITARSTSQSPIDKSDIASHGGEEFVYVLSGAIELHTDFYAPTRLEVGDSVYFDSGMRHALVSVSDEDAQILWIASSP